MGRASGGSQAKNHVLNVSYSAGEGQAGCPVSTREGCPAVSGEYGCQPTSAAARHHYQGCFISAGTVRNFTSKVLLVGTYKCAFHGSMCAVSCHARMLGLVLQRCEEAKSRADSAEGQLRGLKQQLLEAAQQAEATTTQVCLTPTA